MKCCEYGPRSLHLLWGTVRSSLADSCQNSLSVTNTLAYFVSLIRPGVVLTTLHFLHNLQMDPISKCYITLGWRGLQGTNTLAYWVNSWVIKKMKCCEYGPRSLHLLWGTVRSSLADSCQNSLPVTNTLAYFVSFIRAGVISQHTTLCITYKWTQ